MRTDDSSLANDNPRTMVNTEIITDGSRGVNINTRTAVRQLG